MARKRINQYDYLLVNNDEVIGGTDDSEIADAHVEHEGSTMIDLTDYCDEVEDFREEEEEEEEDSDDSEDDEDG